MARDVLGGFPVNLNLGTPKAWRESYRQQTVAQALAISSRNPPVPGQ
jgi:hypothetical protein